MDPQHPVDSADVAADERLSALFKAAGPPAPPPGFAARTVRAVKCSPLPPGRAPLRSPLTALVGWAAILAGVAIPALALAVTQPAIAAGFTRVFSESVRAGVWLMQLARTSLGMFELFATTGVAVSRVVVTTEGTLGLVLVAVVGALSASTLHRLLVAEREESLWQESL